LNSWIKSEQTFPLLAFIAEYMVSAPASEAHVERAFSVCGDLTPGKRNRLSKQQQLENRTFLKMNCKFYDC
jgi:hAT family C-terminal dimerisation region